jgi:leucyl aminopeptidase
MLHKINRVNQKDSTILFIKNIQDISPGILTNEEAAYVKEQREKREKDTIVLNHLKRWLIIQFIKKENETHKYLENCRRDGDKLLSLINDNNISRVIIHDLAGQPEETLALAEGMALGNYQFLKYKTDSEKKKNALESIHIFSEKVSKRDIDTMNIIIDGVYRCRDLVNEPVSALNAVNLAAEIEKMGIVCGAKVEVFKKKKIESLKMGGLLAVNKGSMDSPTFTVMEWKPVRPVNKKPYVFIGKGIVFDSGGLSLKPSGSMETMKSDMAGAAAMASAVYTIAMAKLPIHVIALMPATDNRPDGNSYAPGDVITMFDGTTVEVLNTDAEGRMILGDALSYAKKYQPELVINAATLTGSAAAAIGKYGIVALAIGSDEEFRKLKESGNNVYERLVEFPAWEEYGELIKSDIADIKNIGGKEAGAITAGKFLEHFIDYPFIHLDIAGPAYVEKRDSYRGTGGTGIVVRLLFDFMKNKCV